MRSGFMQRVGVAGAGIALLLGSTIGGVAYADDPPADGSDPGAGADAGAGAEPPADGSDSDSNSDSGSDSGAGAGVDAGPDAGAGAEPKDDAAKNAEAGEDLLGDFADSLGNAFIAFGVAEGLTALINAIWPPPNYAQMLQELGQQLADEQAALNNLASSLEAQNQQLSSIQALAGQGVCATAMATANGHVTTIQDAFANYRDVNDVSWLAANVPDASGVNAFTTIGNYVFGSTPGTNPGFGSGLNEVANATQALGKGLTQSSAGSSGGVIPLCAEAITATVASDLTSTSPQPGVIIVGEEEYFEQMQQITSHYTTWANIGASMSLMGGWMANAILDPEPPTSQSEALGLCAGVQPAASWDYTTCAGTLSIYPITRKNTQAAWGQTGAAWSQATGGLLATALQPASNGYFEGGDTVWVTDIARYGLPANKALAATVSPLPDSTSTQSTLSALNPISDGTQAAYNSSGKQTTSAALALKNTSWLGLDFTAATSAQWDTLLNLNQLPPAGGDASEVGVVADCLPNGAFASTTNCTSQPIGTLLAGTNLANGSTVNLTAGTRTVQAPANMIFYTGETSAWNAEDGPLWWAPYAPFSESDTRANTDLFPLPTGWTFPQTTVASFLDTESRSMNGFSAVMNPPNAQPGDFTPSSVYPLVSSGSQGLGPSGESVYTLTASNTFATPVPVAPAGDSQEGNPQTASISAVACQSGSGVPVANSAFSVGQFFSGDFEVNCGTWTTVPDNVATTVAGTSNTGFYADIVATLITNNGWNYCSDVSNDCPANPWFNSQGDYPGFLLDGGFVATSTSGSEAAATQAVTPEPQTQFMWPVLDTTKCTLTQFTQGGGGNLGVPQMCQEVFQDYMSERFGVDFGPISVNVDRGMDSSGDKFAGVTFSNTGFAQQGTLLIEPSAGLTADPTGIDPSSGLSVSGCTSIGSSNDWECSASIPAGTSYFTMPATVSKLPVSLKVTYLDAQASASDTTALYPAQPSSLGSPPPALEDFDVSAAGANASDRPVLSWTTPALARYGGITGYRVQAVDSNGNKYGPVSVPLADVTVSSDGSVSSLTLPASAQPAYGKWTVTIAAYNSAGTGPSVSTATTYGAAVPVAPEDFTAIELYDGRVRLDWDAVDASPAVTGYTITATNPSGKSLTPVKVDTPGYVTSDSLDTGTWSFSVYASNTVGRGDPATASVKVEGTIPEVPTNVALTLNGIGQMTVTWHAPDNGIVPPQLYNVSLYPPFDAGSPSTATPLAQYTVPVSGQQSIVSLPAAFQLRKVDPIGSYQVAVSAENKHGVGPAQMATIFVNDNVLKTLAVEGELIRDIEAAAVLLQDVEFYACQKGYTKFAFKTGACYADGTWEPLPGFLPTALQAGTNTSQSSTTITLTYRQESSRTGFEALYNALGNCAGQFTLDDYNRGLLTGGMTKSVQLVPVVPVDGIAPTQLTGQLTYYPSSEYSSCSANGYPRTSVVTLESADGSVGYTASQGRRSEKLGGEVSEASFSLDFGEVSPGKYLLRVVSQFANVPSNLTTTETWNVTIPGASSSGVLHEADDRFTSGVRQVGCDENCKVTGQVVGDKVRLRIDYTDKARGTASIRSSSDPNQYFWSSRPVEYSDGDVIYVTLSGLQPGVNNLTVWTANLQIPFQVVI